MVIEIFETFQMIGQLTGLFSRIALHNGGGVGFGQAINGGFGLVLDGTQAIDRTIAVLMEWDVLNGIARRAWSGNDNALNTMCDEKSKDKFTFRN